MLIERFPNTRRDSLKNDNSIIRQPFRQFIYLFINATDLIEAADLLGVRTRNGGERASVGRRPSRRNLTAVSKYVVHVMCNTVAPQSRGSFANLPGCSRLLQRGVNYGGGNHAITRDVTGHLRASAREPAPRGPPLQGRKVSGKPPSDVTTGRPIPSPGAPPFLFFFPSSFLFLLCTCESRHGSRNLGLRPAICIRGTESCLEAS